MREGQGRARLLVSVLPSMAGLWLMPRLVHPHALNRRKPPQTLVKHLRRG